MADGSLTQEEIDRLLQGADSVGGSSTKSIEADEGPGLEDQLPLEKREEVTRYLHHSLLRSSQTLGQLLARPVTIGSAFGELLTQSELDREFSGNYVAIQQSIGGGLSGMPTLVVASREGARLSGRMMGIDDLQEQVGALDSAQLATIKDAFSPMIQALIADMANRVGVAITPRRSIDVRMVTGSDAPVSGEKGYLVLRMPFKCEGLFDSQLTLVVSLSNAVTLGASKGGSSSSQVGDFYAAASLSGPSESSDAVLPNVPLLDIKEVQFPNLNMATQPPSIVNNDLLLDVQMVLTVELGRTRMFIKEILGLGEGSIIELDKLAGEPVDLLVNGKLIAKGEVVVIDENFGVRVTDIVSPVDRKKKGATEEA